LWHRNKKAIIIAFLFRAVFHAGFEVFFYSSCYFFFSAVNFFHAILLLSFFPALNFFHSAFFLSFLPQSFFMPFASFACAHGVRIGVAIYAPRNLNIAARGNAL
jgi:uncharacterized membrane protein